MMETDFSDWLDDLEKKLNPQYIISGDGKSINCLTCGMESYHPNDVKYKYCGNCNKFHEYVSKSTTAS